MPVFIYALNRDDTGDGVAFGISRNPVARAFSGDRFGGPGSPPVVDDQGAVFVATDGDAGDWEGSPVQIVGAAWMKTSVVADDWRLVGSQNGMGFGPVALRFVTSHTYSMPAGQNGNDPGKNFTSTAGLTGLSFAPTMTTRYSISAGGEVAVFINENTLYANGTSDASIRWFLPYSSVVGWSSTGSVYFRAGNVKQTGAIVTGPGGGYAWLVSATGQAIQVDDFLHSNDHVVAELRYRAFEE